MKLVTFYLMMLCWASVTIADSGLRGPPHISGDVRTRYNATIGDPLKLDCPIDSSPEPLYEWSKDGESITPGWERFRVSPKKLRIRGVIADDGGNYICKAVNGFGSKEISIRVVVYDKNRRIVGGQEQETSHGNKLPGEIMGIRPIILETSPPKTGHGKVIRQRVGSSITLSCKVGGQPYPTVTWIKVKGEIQLSKGIGQLELTDVNFEDSGTYYCRASNQFGEANASFVLEVIDREMKKPSIISLEPSNVTVPRGRQIHFRCHISSDTIPNVQWLRGKDENNLDSLGPEALQQMAKSKFVVVGSASSLQVHNNGSYLSELMIKAERGDSGAYLCFATNAFGYNFSKAFLNVMPIDGDPMLPIGILVAIPSTLAILFAGLALVICCFRKSQNAESNAPAPVRTSGTYANPQDLIHNHQQQQPPVPHPFYNPVHNPQAGRTIANNMVRYVYKDVECPMKNTTSNHTSPNAYASVRICEVTGPPNSTFAANRGPPLPLRPNFAQNTRDRNNYNVCHGLLTQPLLTQTASSSDSRDSRLSASGRAEFANHRPIDHWGSSGGSDGSSDRKPSRSRHHL